MWVSFFFYISSFVLMTYSFECPIEENTILWMGNLEPWMNEEYIEDMWNSFAKVATVKVIKDRQTGLCAGYGFVDFGSGAVARMIIKHFNGFSMPNSIKTLRLNWASGGGDKRGVFSIFIGDLGQQTTENEILNIFKSRYASCTSAKIMKDVMTGLSRGYGFVRFSDPLDQQRALFEMQSFIVGARPIRVSMATPKQKSPPTTPLDYNKATISVGGLHTPITEDELRQYFSPFGDIVFVRIPHGESYGSIQFTTRSAAELAINRINGHQMRHSRTLNLFAGKDPASYNKKQGWFINTVFLKTAKALIEFFGFVIFQNSKSSAPINKVPGIETYHIGVECF